MNIQYVEYKKLDYPDIRLPENIDFNFVDIIIIIKASNPNMTNNIL